MNKRLKILLIYDPLEITADKTKKYSQKIKINFSLFLRKSGVTKNVSPKSIIFISSKKTRYLLIRNWFSFSSDVNKPKTFIFNFFYNYIWQVIKNI